MPSQSKHEWKEEDFEIGPMLGKGSFGKVYLARTKEHQYICALKCTSDKVPLNKVLRELRIQSKLRHPNVLRTLGCYEKDIHHKKRLVIIMEYAACGSLDQIMRHGEYSNGFEERIASNIIKQVMSAVDYCHDQNIIHRDIKLENVMVGYDGQIKVGDFGLAKFSLDWNETYCGTGEYMAPEFYKKERYDKSVDYWSVGILTYELLCGHTPFWRKEEQGISYGGLMLKRIINLEYEMPGHFSDDAQNFIKGFLQLKPQDRKSFKQALTHPWIINASEPKSTTVSDVTERQESLDGLMEKLSI